MAFYGEPFTFIWILRYQVFYQNEWLMKLHASQSEFEHQSYSAALFPINSKSSPRLFEDVGKIKWFNAKNFICNRLNSVGNSASWP